MQCDNVFKGADVINLDEWRALERDLAGAEPRNSESTERLE
jgi:hypothetical protein